MKIKRILIFLTAIGFSASLWSCTDKKSSLEKSSLETNITDISKETELPENLRSFETIDGLFSFSTSENIMQTDAENDLNTIIGTNCQFLFREEEHDISLGIMPITNLHQTAEGFSAGLYTSYDEIGEFSNLNGKALAVGDSPAYRITADYENDYIFTVNTVQFGNGDIFAVISSSPATSLDVCERENDIILSTVRYRGGALKTEPETFENDYFSMTIEPKWYFSKTKDDFASIRLNIQNDYNDIWYAFSFSALPDEPNAETAAENAAAKLEGFELTRDKTKFMDCECEHILYKNVPDVWVDYYIFEKDGVCYQGITVCHNDLREQYNADIKKVTENITIK